MAAKRGSIAQQDLFDFPSHNGASTFADPAFATNKSAPVHRWVPWIAGFSREFVQGALERHLRKKGTVLDPFAGVGTTLVEAALAGHNAIGFEINPYAALACRTKLAAYEHSPAIITKAIEAFEDFYRKVIRGHHTPQSQSPSGFKTRGEFYSPKVLQKRPRRLIPESDLELVREDDDEPSARTSRNPPLARWQARSPAVRSIAC